MRAHEIIFEKRDSSQSLRTLHRLKHQSRARNAIQQDHEALIKVMYRDFQHDREELEIERQRIELEQLKAELAQTRAETRKLDREAGLKSQARVTQMARSAMRKRKH